jgi:ATP-dependent phosphofructokinase / diphosphate-dependent phosphofructokinase
MAAPRRIGILTGGGDVPGLNSVIKSVVYRATDLGYEVVGIRRGWEGLTHQRRGPELDHDYARILDRINTRTIDRTGGTVLHSSRTNPRKMLAKALPAWLDPASVADKQVADGVYDLTDHVLQTIEHLGLTNLVSIGGDDTLSFSSVLAERGVPIVAIPKTMDNDVQGTEYCIGFSSAITRAKELINRQRTTLGSHERIGVFRIFGRDAGFTALYTAYVTSTRCVIPEFPYDIEALADILAADHHNNPSRYAVVITAEGAIWTGAAMAETGEADAFGHRHKVNVGEVLASELRELTGIEATSSELTYDLRSGEPDMLDSLVASTFANVAMDLIRDGISGRMVAVRDGKYAHVSLAETAKPPRRVQLAAYDTERFRPRYADRLGDLMLLTPDLGPAG